MKGHSKELPMHKIYIVTFVIVSAAFNFHLICDICIVFVNKFREFFLIVFLTCVILHRSERIINICETKANKKLLLKGLLSSQ